MREECQEEIVAQLGHAGRKVQRVSESQREGTLIFRTPSDNQHGTELTGLGKKCP